MSYHLPSLGDEGSPATHPRATPGPPAKSPEDEEVARTLAEEVVRPMRRQRGWVAVPTFDMREYVKSQVITGAIGFGIGVTIGAFLGNVLKKTGIETPGPERLISNPRHRSGRRRSGRRTGGRRGRPSPEVVRGEQLSFRMGGRNVSAEIDNRGHVYYGDRSVGTIYDFGTYFRAVPFAYYDAEPRNFNTLAGAVKYVVRQERVA